MGVLLVSAYLCLVNLDYAALWHDEAPAAFFGKTLLQQGSIVGWDGRNLVGGTNGRMLNEDCAKCASAHVCAERGRVHGIRHQ